MAAGREASSDYALLDHCICHPAEAGDVGAQHQVGGIVKLGGSLGTLPVNVRHDLFKFDVDLFHRPLRHAAVLGHLQLAGGHTTGVGSLQGP